jgi:hypothetical protein
MNDNLLIVVIASVLVGILLLVVFNYVWYRNQKQKHIQQEKDREEIPNELANHHSVLETSVDSDENMVGDTDGDLDKQSSKWWFDTSVGEEWKANMLGILERYDQNPEILGWIVWDHGIRCAKRHYDDALFRVISEYLESVSRLQNELHFKHFLTASVKGADGELLVRPIDDALIVLLVEDAAKVSVDEQIHTTRS